MADLNFHKNLRDRDTLSVRRRELLTDVVRYTEEGELRKGFNRDFMKYLDEISFRMLTGGEDYYALFLSQTLREIDFNLAFPTASVLRGGNVIFIFNPLPFLYLEELEARALLKHEIYHIILKHHGREKSLKNKFGKLAINLGLDITVNQYISHLPTFMERIGTVNKRFDMTLRTGETLEYYVEEIDLAVKKHGKDTDMRKENGIDFYAAHDLWAESDTESDDEAREKLKGILSHAGDKGVPSEILKILQLGDRGKVSWSGFVKRAMKSMPKGKRKTVARLDRRQPGRLDLRGELRDYVPEITVALDISGSIGEKEMEGFLKELLNLTCQYDSKIRILECDNVVRRDYEIMTLKDIRPLLKRRGGTRFSPVFEYLKEKGSRNTLLIYFTDGLGEDRLSVKPIHHKTIWVVLGKTMSLKDPKGEVIFLKPDLEEVDRTYGIEMMRTMLQEWAK
jgi:predicted metal-dependent peptidase